MARARLSPCSGAGYAITGAGAQKAERLQRDQLRVARPYSQAVEGSVHVFSSASCVTGIKGRQPEKGPIGSALEIAIRIRLPPSRV